MKALSLFSIEVIVVAAIIVAATALLVINARPGATTTSTTTTMPPSTTTSQPTTTSVTTTTAPAINGLKGEYFSNIDFSGDAYTRTDSVIDMAWLNQEAPIEGISGARFSARWTGNLMIEQAGDYMFVITSDDGSRLYMNGVKQADLWDNSGVNSKSATMALTAGKHDIKIEYKNLGGGLAKIKLEYIASRLGIERQVVPSGKLSVE